MVLDLIKKSRTHRHFEETFVEEKDILTILTAARYSSCGRNRQNLRYAYTNDDTKCIEIFKNIALGGALKAEEKPTLEERPRAAIAIATDDNIQEDASSLFFNMGIAAQNITLIANELGFSTCIIMAFNKKEISKIFSLPENFSVKVIVILGKGKENVEIVDITANEDTKYYRKNGKHYVPKIILDDLII